MNQRLLFVQIATGTAIGIAVFFVDIYSKFFALLYLPDTILAPLPAISFLAATAISVFAVALRTQHFVRWSDRHLRSSAAWSLCSSTDNYRIICGWHSRNCCMGHHILASGGSVMTDEPASIPPRARNALDLELN